MRRSTSSSITPVVAQLDDRLALGREDRVPDLEVLEQLLLGLVGGPVVGAGARGSTSWLVAGARSWSTSSRCPGNSSASSSSRVIAGLDRGQPGGGLLALLAVDRRTDAEPPDQPRQGQALADQRRDDHAEGQERSAARAPGSRAGARGPRPATRPRACPPSDTMKTALRGGYGSRARISRAQEPREVGRREDPHDPGDDDRQADRRHRADSSSAARPCRQVVEDRRQLQADAA